MIIPMFKYDLVVYHAEREAFLDRLQELGLVDITTTGWEPDDRERELMLSVEKHKAAVARLGEIAMQDGFVAGEPYATGEEAWQRYCEAAAAVDLLTARAGQALKEADELRVWGVFDPRSLQELERSGVVLRYFSAFTKEFESQLPAWSEEYDIVPINNSGGMTYFTVVSAPGAEVAINAHEQKAPAANYKDMEREAEELEREKERWNDELRRAAASIGLIEEHARGEGEQLHFSQVVGSGREEAEGTLTILEGWATRETAAEVDRFLEENPGIIYLKSMPTPEDEVPVKLKNKKLASPFEWIGNFYSLPRYGTMDLTAFFGPFYMLFFGFCLGDAGYGLIFLLASFVLMRSDSKTKKQVGTLSLLCGIAAVVVGFFTGGFFGVKLPELAIFGEYKNIFLDENTLFWGALGLGVVQIIFAMVLKIVNTTRQFGFKYNFGTIGWLLVILSMIYYVVLPMLVTTFVPSKTVFFAALGVGAVMMLFLHNPKKNPLVNFGSGLWNTYNDITGLLGDVLSYIRLFALCLSGGTLAYVFNDLAFGMTEGMPIGVRQLVILIILVFGHGINLFMSALGAFVHPMRLTFVEFYKNAGFESTQREFTPFAKAKSKERNN
ncbi:V-type ATP synthase subunit I [Alistipes sp. OttesenSCG-928-B03]|nr:V-type ATP synthase subunit I [Alistipes sp. OttesenSCG-928-B03]